MSMSFYKNFNVIKKKNLSNFNKFLKTLRDKFKDGLTFFSCNFTKACRTRKTICKTVWGKSAENLAEILRKFLNCDEIFGKS